ncbi:caspase family protein [Calothrix sp. FACHB-156]|nr:caspase family protein [Calothrix sp. FACHB-156]
MKRRHCLQFGTSLFAALGLSQLDFLHQAHRYAQVIAQSTSRKLALLVGINSYSGNIRPLQGCLTDVEMQRELLIHRFGFHPQDILEVKDAQATRQQILTAFETHLIKQAKPGDIVVFHFSGHGSQVKDPTPVSNQKVNSTLVPVDTNDTKSANVVKDIMGRTLFLLMSAVPTENISVVLDSCYSGGAYRGNLAIRSARLEGGENSEATPEEFDYQQRWLKELSLSLEEFQKKRAQGIAKGVVLAAAKENQLATDAPFDDFHAGAFSYLLTRYLWQQTQNDAVGKVFVNLSLRTRDLAAKSSNPNQDPELKAEPKSNDQKLLYFQKYVTPGAEGVIRKITGEQIEFWLGGIASQTLEGFQSGAIFSLIDQQGKEIGQIEQQSRVGLVGYGKVVKGTSVNVVKPGMLLRERVRGIPNGLTLKVGLDSSLGTEMSQAQTAMQAVQRIEVVPVNHKAVVHYILGRVTENDFHQFQQQRISNPPPVGAIGLFNAGREPVPNSFGKVGESIAEAMSQRLRTKLKSLLAGRILQLLTTSASSLKVATTIKPLDSTATTNASRSNQQTPQIRVAQAVEFKPGTNIQLQVQNNESRNIYISAVLIDSSGNLVVLFPRDWDAPEDEALVPPGKNIAIPQIGDNFQFRLKGPSGTLEVLVLASIKPIRNALKGLQNIARNRDIGKGSPLGLSEDEPVQVMGNLLADLNEMARAGLEIISDGVQAVDTTKLAAISTLIEVKE